MKFLIDTNVISEIMRIKPNLRVKIWLSQQEIINLSIVSLEEMYYGLLYKYARRQLEWFECFVQARVAILSVTPAIAKHSGWH